VEKCHPSEVQDVLLVGAAKVTSITNEHCFRHHLATSARWPSYPLDEDSDHLLFKCPRAQEVWEFFHQHYENPNSATFDDFFLHRCTSLEATTICMTISGNIWKRRNALIFNGLDEDLSMAVRKCIANIPLWYYRCSTASSCSSLIYWCNQFDPP
jgi:hypothetical protein